MKSIPSSANKRTRCKGNLRTELFVRKFSKSSKVRNRVKAVLSITSIVTLGSIGTVATYAGYTDSGDSQITASAGTIQLSIGTVNTKYFAENLGELWPEYPIPDKNIKIMNTGTAPMKYNIKFTAATPSELDKFLDVTIRNGSIILYKGKVAYVDTIVQTIAGQSNHDLTWSYVWPKSDDSVDNNLKYKSLSSASFTVTATN